MINTDTFVKISPAHFAFVVSGFKWNVAKHLLHINNELLKISTGKQHRLIVNMPPRHGKSELISKYFPAWYLSVFPQKKIILTSYEYSFAASWGRKCRDLLKSNSNILNIDINPKNTAADNFSLLQGGSMSCVGAGGAITGKGCDLLIIDDPVKNDAEANSKTYRDKIEDWFYSTAFTRLEPGGAIVLIMTRWHEDDLTGRILSSAKDDWKVLKIPAIAENNCPIGRIKGEALWRERFNEQRLQKIKENLGSYWFSALYQQEPSPAGGGIFKREHFRYFKEHDNFYELGDLNKTKLMKCDCNIFITVDLAVSISEKSDFTAACIFAVAHNNDIIVIDMIKQRIEGAGHFTFVKDLFYKYKPLMIGVEAVQYQLALVQQLSNAGLPVKKLKADKDKVSRALPIAAKIENEKVYFKKDSHWLGDLEYELISFPNSAHDDQTDALSYIDQMIIDRSDFLPIGSKRK